MPAVESENGGRVGIKLHELPEVCLASQAKAAVLECRCTSCVLWIVRFWCACVMLCWRHQSPSAFNMRA